MHVLQTNQLGLWKGRWRRGRHWRRGHPAGSTVGLWALKVGWSHLVNALTGKLENLNLNFVSGREASLVAENHVRILNRRDSDKNGLEKTRDKGERKSVHLLLLVVPLRL